VDPYRGLTVLLLDDDDENRALSAEIFETEHANVVQASTVKDAERELISHPGIDVVSLDLSLRGAGKDKEGAALALRIHAARPELPLIGYSAYFGEGDLSAEEQAAFTWYAERGGSTDEVDAYVNRCLVEARGYRDRRRRVFDEQILQLASQGQIGEREYSVLKSFSLIEDEVSLAYTLTKAGYQVEVILPDPPTSVRRIPSRPFVVWVRRVDGGDEFEAEVFGQPALYGVGEDTKEAIRNLLEVFWLFVEELDDAEPGQLAGPALSLAHFFEHVLSR
jgi:CheY-like chemotaxis protein